MTLESLEGHSIVSEMTEKTDLSMLAELFLLNNHKYINNTTKKNLHHDDLNFKSFTKLEIIDKITF